MNYDVDQQHPQNILKSQVLDQILIPPIGNAVSPMRRSLDGAFKQTIAHFDPNLILVEE
jgi:hypothetical protein